MGCDSMSDVLYELGDLIEHIHSQYTDFTNEWLYKLPIKFNLKKMRVDDIEVNGLIYKHILEYVRMLNEKSAEIVLEISGVSSQKVTSRVKTQNSIEYKINNYKTEQHEYGKIPINKCLNDLFGLRIVTKTPVSFDEVFSFVGEKYNGKYKCIDSSKLEYKATHIYFKNGNCFFPWELQIWNENDVESNFASHKKYKQEYTNWENVSKEGGIFNE